MYTYELLYHNWCPVDQAIRAIRNRSFLYAWFAWIGVGYVCIRDVRLTEVRCTSGSVINIFNAPVGAGLSIPNSIALMIFLIGV